MLFPALVWPLLSSCQASGLVQATPGNAPVVTMALPPIMHFCDVNCTTLKLERGRYVTVSNNNFTDPGWSDIWEIEKFTPESVVLHRTETGRYAFSVRYHGQVSPEGGRLVNATNPFGNYRGQPPYVALAWGSELGRVPGSNAERDAIVRASNRAQRDDAARALFLLMMGAAILSGPRTDCDERAIEAGDDARRYPGNFKSPEEAASDAASLARLNCE